MIQNSSAPFTDPQIRNRDEAEAAMAQATSLQLQLNAVVDLQNAKLILARQHDEEIGTLKKRIARQTERLELWARANREELGEKKSLELRQGTLGFRLGNRAVKLLEGWTDAMVLNKLRQLGKAFAGYIRNNPELNRQAILSDSRPNVALLTGKDLKRMGLEIRQEEKFFIEPKLEEVPA